MNEIYTVKLPKIMRIIGIVNYFILLGIFGYIALFVKNLDLTKIFGFVSLFAPLILIPFFHRLEYSADSITIYRFPFPTKTITWDQIERIRGRRYQFYTELLDKHDKRILSIGLGQEGLEKFFEFLRRNRPDLFGLPADNQFKKRPWIWILILVSLWFIFAIFFSSMIKLSAGRAFAIIYVCVSLLYIFWSVLEVRVENDLIIIKKVLTERTYRAEEISSIGLIKNFRQPMLKNLKINLKNGKSVKVNIEGYNTLILYNQLYLWWETHSSPKEN